MIETILNTNKKIFVFAKDKNLKYIFCNEAAAEIAGLDSPAQIVGKTDYDFVWKPQAEIYRSGDKNVLRGKVMHNVQEPMTQPTRLATILHSKLILTDKDGHPIGIAGHSIDITGHTVSKNSGRIDQNKNIFHLGDNFSNEYLTRREFEIFKYLLMGKSVDEIAFDLGRSKKTVEAQIKNIVNKLQCSHKAEIVPTAVKYGLTYVLDEVNLIKN